MAVLAFGLWVLAVFNGGLDDVLDFSKPSETDEAVQEARAEAASQAVAQAESVATLAVTAFGGETAAAAAGPIQECEVGENSYLRDDPYDLLCFDDAAVAIGNATVTAASAARFDAALEDDGWSPGLSLSRVAVDYPDRDDPPAADYYRSAERLTVDPVVFGAPADLLVTVTVETAVD